MLVPGVGAAVGVARAGMAAYKIARAAKVGGDLAKFGKVSKLTSNLAGRIYTGRPFAPIGKGLVSGDGLRLYRPPNFKPRIGIKQSNFQYRSSHKYSFRNPRQPDAYNGHLRVR